MQRLSNKNFVWALIIVSLSMCVCWVIYTPRFTETTDDMIMASFAYGYMNGYYSSYLVYINRVIGLIIQGLLMVFPHCPWYTVLQVLIIYCSSVIIVYLLKIRFKEKASFAIVLYLLTFGYEFFSNLQFTKTAGIAVIAGFLFVFDCIERKRKTVFYILGMMLILLGSLYRFRIFEELLLVFFGVGIAFLFKRFLESGIKGCVRLVAFFLALVIVAGTLYFGNLYSYNKSDVWSGFWDNNALRDTLQNSIYVDETSSWPDFDENKELYTSLNITENDLALYKAANFMDTELFTHDVMEALVEAKGNNTIDIAFLIKYFFFLMKRMLYYPAFLVCIIFTLFILGMPSNKNSRWLMIYEWLVFSGVQGYFLYRGRYLQNRTDQVLFLALFLILLMYCVDLQYLKLQKRSIIMVCGLFVILLAPSSVIQYELDKNEMENAVVQTEIRREIAQDKEHFYFYYHDFSNMPDVMYNVWYVAEPGCGANCSNLGTWRSQTPFVAEKLANYDIYNPYRSMINNDKIYFVCNSSTKMMQVLTHIKEHYDEDAQVEFVKTIGELQVYRFYTYDSNSGGGK